MAHGARGYPHSLMEVRLLRVGVGSGHDRPPAEFTVAEQPLKVAVRKQPLVTGRTRSQADIGDHYSAARKPTNGCTT